MPCEGTSSAGRDSKGITSTLRFYHESERLSREEADCKMATVRVDKISDYTTLSNRALDDERLSMKAVGLLVYMLRLPDDWDFTLEWLEKKHRDGLSSIRSAMKELEEAGYVTRGNQKRGQGGTFLGSDYIIREDPDGSRETRTVTACENRTRTACEKPTSVFPTSENRMQPNTKLPSTKKPKPPKPPRGRRRWKEACEHEPELFERFWKKYPRKDGKGEARYEWDDLKPDRELMKEMSAALRAQKATDEWQRGIGIPWACRWIRYRRWENEGIVLEDPDEEPDEAEDLPEWTS